MLRTGTDRLNTQSDEKGESVIMNIRYKKEIIILVLQVLLFYLLPLTAGPGDEMGLVAILILSAFALSVILGAISDEKIRFLYPLAAGIFFIPSVFIYYNGTALIQAVWYAVITAVGIAIGTAIQVIARRVR